MIGTASITTAMRMSMLRAVWAQYYNYGTQEQMQERYQDRKNFYDQQKANYDKLVAEIEEKYRIPLQQVKAEYDALETEYHSREGDERNQNLIWSWVKDDETSFISTKLGIEASWNTYLGGFRPIDGSYGIRVRIKGRLKATATAPAQAIEDEIIFSSDEFYGNPYAYYTTYSQQVVYDISRFHDIQGIQVYFWQDHNFLDEYGSAIPWQQTTDSGELIPVNPNIKMAGLRVLLGMEADEIAEETVFLYTYDSLSFGRNAADSTVTNNKTLRFCWVHQDGDTWVTVKTPEKLYQYGADIYWYHQKYNAEQNGANPPETWAGINYELLNVRGIGGLRNAFEYNATLDPDQAYERYRAAVTWGKRHVTSETLEFSNVDHTISEQLVGDNEIILRILEADWYTEDGMSGPVLEDNNEGYSITPSDGREDFFVYDENNRVIRDKYNRTYSSIDYYIQVWIRSDMGSEYVPLQVLENDDPTFDVEWSFPEKYTMLDHFDTLNAEDAKSESLVPNIVENSSGSWRAKAVEVTQKTTRKFRIKDTWNLQYTNNTIAVDVHYHGKTYHASKEMTFGESGSDGSEFTVAIHQGTPTTLGLQPQDKFVLYATVHDSSGARVESAGFVFTWQLLSPTLITKTALEDIPSSWQNSDWNYEDNHEGYGAYTGACISGYIRDASDTNSVYYGAPPIFKVTVANAAAYPISNVRAFMLVKNKTLTVDPYNFSLPSRVEFKADGTSPVYLASPFLRWEGIQNPVYSYPDWELKQWGRNTISNEWYAKEPPEKLRLKAQTTSSKQIDNNDNYSLASYSSTINAALTANPVNWMATDSECPIDYLNYSSTETYGSFSEQLDQASNSARRLYFTSQQSDEDEETFNERIKAVEAIQTVVNSCVSRYVKSYTEYTLDPYMNSSDDLEDSWYWTNGMDTDYYTWIGYEEDFGYVRQAIAFTRNVYSSSLVNSWDGTLTLDEEHNALLTRMVSAGSKDSENRFTGVIMGDWADYGNNSIDIVGLYGFNAGVEMFGFRSDGTGFIGKAGKGQIQFDGRYALISNYDHTCYMNLDPILYGSDGQVNDATYMGYSPYFLYAQTPRSSPINATIETLEERVFWSKKFLEDTSNDYFIVDPNNGILMTGGIVSTYGKIGNWMISDNGLYQKHQTNDISTSHYMYLGYNSFPDDQTLATAVNQENLRFSNKLTEIKGYATTKENRATTLWQIIQEVGEYFPAIFKLDPRHYMNYGWGFQWAAEYLEECLKQVGLQADDLSYRLWIWDRTNLQTYFLSDERVRFVYHYHYEEDGSKSGPFQTGGYYTARPLLCLKAGNSTNTDMSEYEPSPSVSLTYYKHSVQGLYTTLWQAYQNNVILTADYIQSVIDGWHACYDVYFNDYYDQLVEQYNMAVENDSIPASVWSDLKRRYPDFFDPALIDHRADLQKLIAAETLKHNQIIQGLYAQDDEHRYAIFAGHYPDDDPLFSVNWRGYMTARAGKIGHSQPWYITDYGLTQKNNSAIIFLGDPEAPSNPADWVDLAGDIDNLIVLPNGTGLPGDDRPRGPLVPIIEDEIYTNTYGGFAISAGEDSIKFGVRPDGTLFSSRGVIGGWGIYADKLGTYGPLNVISQDGTTVTTVMSPIIELDSAGKITIAHGNIILDGTTAMPRVLLGEFTRQATVGINGFYLSSISADAQTSMAYVISGPDTIDTLSYTWYDMRGIGGTSDPSSTDTETLLAQRAQLQNSLTIAETKRDTAQANINATGSQTTIEFHLVPSQSVNMDGQVETRWSLSESLVSGMQYYTKSTQATSRFGSGGTSPSILQSNYNVTMDNYMNVVIPVSALTTTSGKIIKRATSGQNPGTQEVTEVSASTYQGWQDTVTQQNALIAQYNSQINTINNQLAHAGGSSAFPVASTDWNFGITLGQDGGYLSKTYSGQYLKIASEQYDHHGFTTFVGTETADDDNTNPSSTVVVVLRPTTSNAGFLENWNLHGDSVVANEIYGKQSIYMNKKLVATQPWVQDIKDKLSARIVTVNNTAHEALTKAEQGIHDAAQAASDAQSAADTATAALEETITDIKYSVSVFAEPGVNLFKIDATKKNGTVLSTENWWAAGRTHRHDLEMSNGAITIGKPNSNDAGSAKQTIFSSGDVSLDADGGKIKLTIKIAGATGTANFNMADTAWYKARDIKTAAIEALSADSSKVHVHITHSDETSNDYDTEALSVNVDEKKVTLGSTGASIDVSSVYKAGWVAAINHAKAKAKIRGGGATGSITITNVARSGMSSSTYSSFTTTDGTTYSSGPYTRYRGGSSIDAGTYYTGVSSASIDWSDVSSEP